MNFSVKVNLRRPARRDGTCVLRLQVIIGGKVWLKNLELGWPKTLFDDTLGICLTTLPTASQLADYQKVLE